MLQDDALTNFQPLMMNKYKLESWFYKNRWGGRREGGSGWGTHVNPWLIHVNVWQKPLQYCKVISLQRIKINEKKKRLALDILTAAQEELVPLFLPNVVNIYQI